MASSRSMSVVACAFVLIYMQSVVETIRVNIELDDVMRDQIRKEITDILADMINQGGLKDVDVIGDEKPPEAEIEEKTGSANTKQIIATLLQTNKQLIQAFQTEKRLNRRLQRRFNSIEKSVLDVVVNMTSMEKYMTSIHQEFKTSVKILKDDVKELSKPVQKMSETLEIVRGISMDTCKTVLKSGVHNIYVDSMRKSVPLYCDQDTDGGGWIVFMRRQNGSENFTRSWQDYKTGFGNREGEFWAGNELLHQLTESKPTQLRIDLEDFDGNKMFAQYEQFQIGPEEDKYRLTVSDYSGTAGDGLIDVGNPYHVHNGQQFSTVDSGGSGSVWTCADHFKGGWWYNSCFNAHLTGVYTHNSVVWDWRGVVWQSLNGRPRSQKFVEMKIR